MFPVVLIALCALAAPAPEIAVQTTPVTGVELEAFQKSYADHRLNTAGWSGNFHQEAHSPDLLAPITSDGNLAYRAPASLEMSYTTPLVGQVWIQKDEVGQKFPGRSPQVAAAPMVRSLLEFFRQPPAAWEKDFTQTAQRDHDVMRIQLTVKPSATAGQPSQIVVEVNALTLDPLRLEIVFAEKTSLVFIFSDWKSLGPASAIPLEPPTHEPTPSTPRPGFSPH
jgi:hypothetical protein